MIIYFPKSIQRKFYLTSLFDNSGLNLSHIFFFFFLLKGRKLGICLFSLEQFVNLSKSEQPCIYLLPSEGNSYTNIILLLLFYFLIDQSICQLFVSYFHNLVIPTSTFSNHFHYDHFTPTKRLTT